MTIQADDQLSNTIVQQPGEAQAPAAPQPSASKHAYEMSSENPDMDPDAIAAREAERLAEAEASGDPDATQTGEQQQENEPEPDARDARQGSDDGRQPMVPKGRLDHESGRRRTAEEKVDQLTEQDAYMRGRLDQMGNPPAPAAAEPEAPKPDPREQRLAELKTQMVELEESYNNAQITSAERTARVTDINDEMIRIRAEQIVEARMPPPVASVMDQALEERHAEDLESRYPHLQKLSQAQLAVLSRLAHTEAELIGKPYVANSVADNMRLRESIAQLSLSKRGIWFDVSQPTAAGGNGNNQPTNQPAKPLSAKASAVRQKVAMANEAPSDIRNLGRASDADAPPSDTAILRMSDRDLENLRPEELDRLGL